MEKLNFYEGFYLFNDHLMYIIKSNIIWSIIQIPFLTIAFIFFYFQFFSLSFPLTIIVLFLYFILIFVPSLQGLIALHRRKLIQHQDHQLFYHFLKLFKNNFKDSVSNAVVIFVIIILILANEPLMTSGSLFMKIIGFSIYIFIEMLFISLLNYSAHYSIRIKDRLIYSAITMFMSLPHFIILLLACIASYLSALLIPIGYGLFLTSAITYLPFWSFKTFILN